MDISFILFIIIVLAAFGFAIYAIVSKSTEKFVDGEKEYRACIKRGGGSSCHKYIK